MKHMKKLVALCGLISVSGCTGVRTIGYPGVEALSFEFLKIAAVLCVLFGLPVISRMAPTLELPIIRVANYREK